MDIPWRGERRLEPTAILGALENQYGLDGNGTGNQWTMVCPRSISFGYGHPEGKFGFELALDPPIISCKNLSMKKNILSILFILSKKTLCPQQNSSFGLKCGLNGF